MILLMNSPKCKPPDGSPRVFISSRWNHAEVSGNCHRCLNHLMIKIHRHPFQQREGWDLIKYPNNSKINLYINDFYYVDVKFKYRKDIDIHK